MRQGLPPQVMRLLALSRAVPERAAVERRVTMRPSILSRLGTSAVSTRLVQRRRRAHVRR
jgi:hypothetical protein